MPSLTLFICEHKGHKSFGPDHPCELHLFIGVFEKYDLQAL